MLYLRFEPGDAPDRFIRVLRIDDQEHRADIQLQPQYNAQQQREQDEPSALPAARLQALGQELAQLALGDIGLQTLKSYRRQRRACPIVIEESPQTARCSQIAWELLHDGDDFIAINPHTPIQRRMAGIGSIEAISLQQPLKMLIFWSSPSDASTLAIEDEQMRIAQALAPQIAARRIDAFELYHCSREQLRDALSGADYDIIYYSGHGLLSADGETRLCMQDEQGQRQDLAPLDFKRLLDAMDKPPALVFLNCCYSAGIAGTAPLPRFNDYARRLQDYGVPWVIATITRVYDYASQTFVQRLFAALGESVAPNIAKAVALARAEVLQAHSEAEQAQSFYRYLLFDNSAAELKVDLQPRSDAPPGDIAAVSERLPGNLHEAVPRNWAAKSIEDLWRERHASIGLYGLGGLGKTTLAALLAQHALHHPLPQLRADTVLWLDLEQCAEGAALLQQLAEVLNSRGYADTARWLCQLNEFNAPVIGQKLREALGSQVLLILDNAESVLNTQQRIADPSVRRLLLALIAHAHGWRSLITSRVSFDFAEDGRNPAPIHWRQLAAMRPMERAVLLERLLKTRNDLSLSREQRQTILQRIADTPWALNLFIGHLQPDSDVVHCLEQVLQAHGEYANLAYYLRHLQPAQRIVLELLALLDESLPTEQLDALYPVIQQTIPDLPDAVPSALLPGLQQLALLYRDEAGHYDSYPTLRAYLQRQQQGLFATQSFVIANRSMAEIFYELSEAVGQKALQRLQADAQDAAAPELYFQQLQALHRAVRHAFLQDDLALIGLLLENLVTISAGRLPHALLLAYARHLETHPQLDTSPQAALLIGVAGKIFSNMRAFDFAIAAFSRARQLAEITHPDQVGNTLHNLASVFLTQRNWSQAECYCRKAIDWNEKTGQLQQLGSGYHQLGKVFQEQRDWVQAEHYYREAIAWKKKTKQLKQLGSSYHQLGWVFEEQRDWLQAEHYYRKAIAWNKKTEQLHLLGVSYHQLGSVFQELCDWSRAERYYRQAIDWNGKTGQLHQLGGSYHQLGSVFQEQRDWAQAERYYREAIAWYEKTGQLYQLGNSYWNMGLLYQAQQQTEVACHWLAQGVAALCIYAPENPQKIAVAFSDLTETLATLEPNTRDQLWEALCQTHPLLATLMQQHG